MPRDDRLELLIDALAAYRLTRLVTTDALTDGVRSRLSRALADRPDRDELREAQLWGENVADAGGPLVYLLHCPQCAAVWVAAGVAVARRVRWLPWAPTARVLALAAVAGWVAARDD